VLTPDFCQSKWAELERTSAIADAGSGVRRKVRPLLLQDCEKPRFLKPIQHLDVSTQEAFENLYPKLCRELGGTPSTDELSTNRTTLPSVKALPKRYRMPYRSLGRNFAGRVSDIWKLDDLLNKGKTALVEGVGVVVGTGGLGKSQLAIEYAHRFAGRYPGGVFWADADQGLATAVNQIAKAAELELDGKLPAQEQAGALWRALGAGQPVLIILDNFPANESLRPWLPVSGAIQTLVTTRRRDLSGYERLPLGFLDEHDSIALLSGAGRTFGQEALPLVRRIGGLPLALELMRNYLNLQPKLTIEELVAEMDKLGELKVLELFAESYSDELPSGHQKGIGATFELSWRLASAEAQSCLQVIALIAPAPVPRRLIRQTLDIPQEGPLSDPIDKGIAKLATLSLVDLDEEQDPRAHRLVCAFVEKGIRPDDSIRQKAIAVVREELSRVTNEQDTQAYEELEKVVAHGAKMSAAGAAQPETSMDICDYIRWHHRKHGMYRLAEEFGRRALSIAQSFEPGHPSIAIRQSNLALVLQDLGELAEARDLLKKAFKTFLKKFGRGHPHTKTGADNLAAVEKELS